MTLARKLLLGFGAAIIVTMFFIASRPPDQAEIEYQPPAPSLEASSVVRHPAGGPAAVESAGVVEDRRPPPAE